MDEVKIRRIDFSDTDLIIKWRNNNKVRKNFIYRDDFTKETHEKWMNTQIKDGKAVQFIITIGDKNTPIGSVYFRDIDYENGIAEYGIFIGEEYARGKGYGTEAAKAALEYAFDILKLKKIFLRVFKDNTGAIKSYEKVGFEFWKEDMVKLSSGEEKKIIFMKINSRKSDGA